MSNIPRNYSFNNGNLYKTQDDDSGGCTACSFRNDSDRCIESQAYLDCSEFDVVWLKVEEPMKSITQEIKDWKGEMLTEQIPGTKYDSDKLQYSLIPPLALEAVARNLTIGLKKYKERDNWQKVPNASQRYLDALYRHLEAHRKGEIYDPDSSAPDMPHLAAVAVNAMFLLEFMLDKNLKEVTQ